VKGFLQRTLLRWEEIPVGPSFRFLKGNILLYGYLFHVIMDFLKKQVNITEYSGKKQRVQLFRCQRNTVLSPCSYPIDPSR